VSAVAHGVLPHSKRDNATGVLRRVTSACISSRNFCISFWSSVDWFGALLGVPAGLGA